MQDEPTSGGDAPTAQPTVSDAFQEAKEAFAAAGSVIGQNVKKVVKKARRAIGKATSGKKKATKTGKKKAAKTGKKKAARKPARKASAAKGRKVAKKKTAARKKAGRAKK